MSIHAINTETSGISEYQDLTLLKLVEFDGRVYGLTATGLLEFTGSDDSGTDIDAYIQTGKLFGGLEEARVDRAYVKCQAADDLSLAVTVDELDAEESGSETTVTYTMPGKSGTKQQTRTERLRTDLKGPGWSFKLSNVDGGALSVRAFVVEAYNIEIDH